MAGSVRGMEYTVTVNVKTDLYEDEIGSIIEETLEDVGIEVLQVKITRD